MDKNTIQNKQNTEGGYSINNHSF